MKLKKDFVLRQVSGSWVVLPIGSNSVNFDGMITLNDSAKTLWTALENGADEKGLVCSLLEEYEVDEPTALEAVKSFLAKISELGFIE